MTTDAIYKECRSDWSHPVSAVGTTRWLQREQTLPLSVKGVACKTVNHCCISCKHKALKLHFPRDSSIPVPQIYGWFWNKVLREQPHHELAITRVRLQWPLTFAWLWWLTKASAMSYWIFSGESIPPDVCMPPPSSISGSVPVMLVRPWRNSKYPFRWTQS